MEAPKIIGILNKNEYLAEVTLSKPKNRPVAIVHPEREKPGHEASPCAIPINIEVFKSTSDFFASIFLDLYSL